MIPNETTETKSTPIDFVFSDIADVEKLKKNGIKTLGDLFNRRGEAEEVVGEGKVNELLRQCRGS